MATAAEILASPDYINANLATKEAIFQRHISSSPDYINANSATKAAIRQRFGLAPEQTQQTDEEKMQGLLGKMQGMTGQMQGMTGTSAAQSKLSGKFDSVTSKFNDVASILKHPDYINANDATKTAIRQRFGITDTQAATAEEPQEYAGFFGSFGEEASKIALAKAAHAWNLNPTDENRRALLEAAKSKYKHVGFGEGHNWEALKEVVGGTLGSLAAPVAAGTGAAAGVSLTGIGVVTAPVAGFVAGKAVTAEQYLIDALIGQAEEDERAIAEGRTPSGPSFTKAASSSAFNTALDIKGEKMLKGLYTRTPFVKNIVSPTTRKQAQEAAEVVADAVQQGTIKNVGGIARGVGKGVAVEVPQEFLQSVSTRWASGKSLSDDEAIEEYKQTIIGSAILGGAMGGGEHYLTTKSQKKAALAKEEAEQVLSDKFTETRTGRPVAEEEIKGSDKFKAEVQRYMTEYNLKREEAEQYVRQLEEFKDEPTTSDTRIPASGTNNTGDGASVQVPSGQAGGEGPAAQAADTGAGGVGVSGRSVQSNTRADAGGQDTLATPAPPAAPKPGVTRDPKIPLSPDVETQIANIPQKTHIDVVLDAIAAGGDKKAMTDALSAYFFSKPAAYRAIMDPKGSNIKVSRVDAKGRAVYAGTKDIPPMQTGIPKILQETLNGLSTGTDARVKFDTNKAKWVLTQPGADVQTDVSAKVDVKREQAIQTAEAERKLKQRQEEQQKKEAADKQAADEKAAAEAEAKRQAEEKAAADKQAADEKAAAEAEAQRQAQEQAAAAEVQRQAEQQAQFQAQQQAAAEAEAQRVAKAKADRARKAAEQRRQAVLEGERIARIEAAEKAQEDVRKELPPLADDATPEQIAEWSKARDAMDKRIAAEQRARAEEEGVESEEDIDEEVSRTRYARRGRVKRDVARVVKAETKKTKPINPKVASIDVDEAAAKIASVLNKKKSTHNEEEAQARRDAEKTKQRVAATRDRISKGSSISKEKKIQPDGPFEGTDGQVVGSESMDPKYVAYLRALTKALKIQDLRIFLHHPQETKGIDGIHAYGLYDSRDPATGAITRYSLASTDTDLNSEGGAQNFGYRSRDFHIAIKAGMGETKTLEVIAHELGHVIELMAFKNAPPHVQLKIKAEYSTWLDTLIKGGPNGGYATIRQFVNSLRNRENASELLANFVKNGYNIDTDTIDHFARNNPAMAEYFTSFDEWFADNVSKWATTSATPVGIVEKFFKEIAAKLRQLASLVTGNTFVPNSTVAEFLDDMHAHDHGYAAKWRGIAPTMSPLTSKIKASTQEVGPRRVISKELEKVQRSQDATEQTTSLIKIIKEKNAEEFKGTIDDTLGAIKPLGLRKFVKILPSSSIIGWAKDKAKKGSAAVKSWAGRLTDVSELVEGMAQTKINMQRIFSEKAKRLEAFVTLNGQEVLGRVINLARLHAVSAATWDANTTLDQAIDMDDEVKHYQDLISKTDPKEKRKLAGYNTKLAERTRNIKEVHDVWVALGTQKKGQEIYKELMQFYKDMYNIKRFLLDKDIDNIPGISEEAKLALKAKAKEAHDMATKGEMTDDDLFKRTQVEAYFPQKRFGQYWLTVLGGPTGKEFYTFDSIRERNAFKRKRAGDTADPISTDSRRFDQGDDIASLRDRHLRNDSELLKEMFSVLDKEPADVDIAKLKDDLAQVWLSTLPERSARKHFMHSENVTGFSTDVLRVFKDSANGYSNQIAKMQFGNLIRAQVQAGRALLAPSSDIEQDDKLSSDDREKMRIFLDEIELRAEEEINPPKRSGVVAGFNRVSFIWFLTSPATALTQMTSIPIRVMPRAGAQYGYTAAGKMLTKYMNIFKSVGRTVNENGERTWLHPTVGNSSLVRTSPLNKRFYEAGVNHGVFDTLDSALITEDRATKDEVAKDLNKVYKYTTLLFQNSEKISREIAYMMNAELAYNAHIKSGMDPKAAEEQAIKDAVEATRDTMGNYREFERPSIMRSDIGRAVFLFKMYAVNQTKFLWTNAIQMFKHEDAATRWRLKKELAGVLTMAGVFGGVTALPLYSTICWLLDLLQGDDDDRNAEDPFLSDDNDSRFRYEWLPSHFGAEGAKIMERGLVSYLTGANVSSRVSLDNLWFRNPQYSPTYAGKFYSMLEANLGPNVSVMSNYAAAADDFSNGNTERGIEKVLPAGLKGFATATRLAREGSRTYKTDTMVDKEDLSFFELAGASMGFQPTDVADATTKRNAMEAARAKWRTEKGQVLGLYNMTRYNENATDADWDRVGSALEKFNRRYPQEGLSIDDDAISQSEKAFDSAREKAVYGSPMTEEELVYAPWFTEGRNYK